jgi:hypothetical protein
MLVDLLHLSRNLRRSPASAGAVSCATFEAWRERAGSLATIEAFDGTNFEANKTAGLVNW